MKQHRELNQLLYPLKLSTKWRVVWYSVLIWFLGFMISAVIMLPWYYVVQALVIISATIFYFKIIDPLSVKRGRRAKVDADKVFAFGLTAGLAWFSIITILTIAEIAG